MAEPVIGLLKFRVLDPVSGAVLIDPLPHPHQSKIEVRAIQPGTAGATTIGQWTVPLFPPDTDQGRSALIDYGKLAYGQRIEAYLIDSNAAGAPGDPKFSGYITGLPNAMNARSITAVDSTWLAQRARTDRTLAFNGTTDTLLKNSLKAYGLIYGDDVCTSFTGYTNNGTWTTIADEGLNGFLAGTGGDGLLYTTTTYTNAQYADCVIDGIFHLTADSSVAGRYAEGAIIAAVTDANNFVLGRVTYTTVSSNQFTAQLEIYTKSAGVYTSRISLPAFTGTNQQLRCQVRMFGTQSGANYTWRVTVNGFDVGCTYTYAATPSGAIGFRSNKAGNASNESAFATYLYFANKQSLFAQGSITAGSKTINQTFSRVPLLELWNIAANTEGFVWRKNPKAGLFADTVDFSATAGADTSGKVRFEEGLNLVACDLAANALPLATEIELLAAPGTDNNGSITWHSITAMRTYGVIADSYALPDVADFLSQRSHVQTVAKNRAKPGVAKKITVLRDPDTADKWRELDTVTIHAPRLGVYNQLVTVLGYTFDEGSATQDILGDQLPWM